MACFPPPPLASKVRSSEDSEDSDPDESNESEGSEDVSESDDDQRPRTRYCHQFISSLSRDGGSVKGRFRKKEEDENCSSSHLSTENCKVKGMDLV